MITLREFLEEYVGKEVKLHLGCGGVRWKDFINVDFYDYDCQVADTSRSGCVADAYADIRDLKLRDNSIDEIFASHVFEHFTRWQGEDMLVSWFKFLKPGGRMVIETPDFWRCVFWLFHPLSSKRRLGFTQFYGNQWDRLEYETHRYLWSARELSKVCKEIGFLTVSMSHRTETHHPWRDMRIEAVK